MLKLYPLGDRLSIAEQKQFNLKPMDYHGNIKAIYQGEKRCPRKGEWYLSGAEVHAYRASNDLSSVYMIAKLVKTQTRTITTILP